MNEEIKELFAIFSYISGIISLPVSVLSFVMVMRNYTIIARKRLSITALSENPFDEVEIKLINIGIRPVLIESYSVIYSDVRENIKKGSEIFHQNIEERLDELEQLNIMIKRSVLIDSFTDKKIEQESHRRLFIKIATKNGRNFLHKLQIHPSIIIDENDFPNAEQFIATDLLLNLPRQKSRLPHYRTGL